jgi:sec-independent protein translocase protein TatA
MIGDLFDSPWKILIVALVIIVLFGSKKLPSAARSLGQSMRILKKEVQGLHDDEPEPHPAGAQPAAQAPGEVTAGASGGPSATAAAAAAEASRPARQPS